MSNNILERFKSQVKIRITGKNIERFIKRIYKNDIEILDLEKLNRKEIMIIIYLNDLKKIIDLKTIYNIEITDYKGKIKIKKLFYKNIYLIITTIFSLIIIIILSNIIFSIDIIHSNKKIRDFVIEELNKYGINKYTFKKNFNEINDITHKILKNNKDKLEWMSIEVSGTKIIVKVEERKLNSEIKVYPKQDIIATKSGIIKSIKATNGVIIKNINDYVKKDDVIISGKIMDTYGENIKSIVSANGNVYAEVWYMVSIEYPLFYYNEIKTGKSKEIYQIQFLNKYISLFDLNKYKKYVSKENIIQENYLLPIKFLKVKQEEINIEDNIYTIEEALIKAREYASNKIKDKLDVNEFIISQKDLNFYVKDSKIILELFFTVQENIGIPKEITIEESIKE